ncbi:hypothetical protein [Pseudonocardia halophobica]|uniref:hypothetical protein n=1 Tax=Pseudonocardia halophobica TaxID=29401 RepID=UPI001E4AC3AE|nr:hypothetical protein [Pseudonocardia halophobica]
MSAQLPGQPSERPLPERVAAAVLSHPAVVRLDGGPFGSVASYLPGRRVVGVRAGEGAAAGEPVEVAVVVRWPAGTPLPELAEEIAARVRGVAGERPVDVTVADLVPAPITAPAPAPVPGALAEPAGGGPATGPGPAGTPGTRLA